MSRFLDHSYIWTTVGLMVYSQLVMRWQASTAGEIPLDGPGKLRFIAMLLFSPWVISSLIATFVAGVSWMLALTRFEISYAYPFYSLNYVIVFAASVLLFNESLSLTKILGTILVIAGIVVISKG